jgi:hypothetical protein
MICQTCYDRLIRNSNRWHHLQELVQSLADDQTIDPTVSHRAREYLAGRKA